MNEMKCLNALNNSSFNFNFLFFNDDVSRERLHLATSFNQKKKKRGNAFGVSFYDFEFLFLE
jgi:hypothetical protein